MDKNSLPRLTINTKILTTKKNNIKFYELTAATVAKRNCHVQDKKS